MQDRPFVLYSLHAALDPVEPDSLVLLESAEVVSVSCAIWSSVPQLFSYTVGLSPCCSCCQHCVQVHGTADCMQEPARQAEVFRVAHASQLAKEVSSEG